MDTTAALVPAVIAGYDVVRLLGEGGHGRCYLVRPPARLGASPTPDSSWCSRCSPTRVSEQAYERGVRELRAVAAVRSPHLVRVFDAVLEASFAYAMEHFPLGSLAAPAHQPSRTEVLTALEHAARAAHALHEAGIAHGDLRPGNVLLAHDAAGAIGGRLSDPGALPALTPGAVVPGVGRASSWSSPTPTCSPAPPRPGAPRCGRSAPRSTAS